MQEKGRKFKKKGKHQVFQKKTPKIDLEIQEIEELQSRYDQIDVKDVKTFADLPLSRKTLMGLKEAHFKTPTAIQLQSIPAALQGKDILGSAITGSGKTLAFLIPVIESLFVRRWTRMDGVGAIIITPTRELAYQIFETINKIGRHHEFTVALIIGGQNLKFERKRMDKINIVVATPGRLKEHMEENPLFNTTTMEVLVLDEADRCLDAGFEEQLNAIIADLPHRQTLLFSATQTRSVEDLARLSLSNPTVVAPHEQSENATPAKLEQHYIVTELGDKITTLWTFLTQHPKDKIVVFMSTVKQVKYVHDMFEKLKPGMALTALYGNLHQSRRLAIYNQFMNKRSGIVLFATDIASRGLDFSFVTWVVQLDCPEDAKAYIHRAGRAARHKAKGKSLLVLLPSEEEAMIEELQANKVTVAKMEVDTKKLIFNPAGKMASILVANGELKATAQRAFVSYFKSVVLMKNKKIFKVDCLDPDAFAKSLGLEVTPRVRFLERLRKKQKPNHKSDSEEEKNFTSIMAESDSDDDLLTVKRKDHELETEEVPLIKKTSKVITKASVAKKIGKKKIIPNNKTVFDEDGNIVSSTVQELQSEFAKEYQNTDEGGIEIEQAKKLIEEEDKHDKERFKGLVQKRHKERKLKEKKKLKDDSDEDEFGSDSDDQPDLSWLPDPDKHYGYGGNSASESEEEEPIHRAPKKLVAKKAGKRKLEEEPTVQKKKKKKQKTKELLDDLDVNDLENIVMSTKSF